MAIKFNMENPEGQVYGYWVVKKAIQYYDLSKMEVEVIGYKSKATYIDGKQGIYKKITIDANSGWQINMTLNEIENVVLAHPDFVGSTKTT